MAASNGNHHHKSSSSRHHHQQQLVSTMIKQGFISDPFLSPSRINSLSPPPSFRAVGSPSQSPTLFEMISAEPKAVSESHKKIQERVSLLLSQAPFRVCNQWGVGDVRLTVAARAAEGEEGFRAAMDVHRRVLAAKSRFFAEKLRRSGTHSVEILDCDDVVAYVEAVILMYCDELKTEILGWEVSKILTLLKICSAIIFDDGIRVCLDYLEAIPWSEQEQESIVSLLNQLGLKDSRTDAVLERIIPEPSTSSRTDEIFLKLSLGILQAKDGKARKEMKSLIFKLLREDRNSNILDISKDTLYHLCHKCLSSLILCLSGITCVDENKQDRGSLMADIAREADNLQWIVGILIDRKCGEEFVKLWADQTELANLHSKIPIMYRHEISKITAQLCISIGKGEVLVPKDTRFGLLSTWLEALYDDFGWMKMSGRSVDRRLIEEGLSQTVLTLSLPQQQSILLNWFERFLKRGEDCPNIQRAFEVWWRRAFVKQYAVESQLQITVCDVPH